MSKNRFKSALVLSGGSARGLAHLGVIEEIGRRNIRFDMIVGSSMGAIIGGLYAYYGDAATVVAKLRKLFASDLFVKTASAVIDDGTGQFIPDGFLDRFIRLFRRGVYYTHSMLRSELVSESLYGEIMGMLMPDIAIENLPIPFAAVAMDLATGDEIVITKGSLRKAVAASSAIPGLFPVIEINGRPLLDGGWVDNVPVAPAIALGAHFVLAVDTTLEISGMPPYPQTAIETAFRCNEIGRILLTRHRKSHADVLIAPEIGEVFWADLTALDKCVSAGRAAFNENASTVMKKAALRRYLTCWGSIHPCRAGEWHHPFLII